jgi:hypothetical protein
LPFVAKIAEASTRDSHLRGATVLSGRLAVAKESLAAHEQTKTRSRQSNHAVRGERKTDL